MNIVPVPGPEGGEHGYIVGQKRSGKTTTAFHLLSQVSGRYPIFVLDTKGDRKLPRLPGAVVVTSPDQLHNGKLWQGTIVYRPEGRHNEPDWLDWSLQAAYERRQSMYVYVDELYQVCSRGKPGTGLANCLMRGREREGRDGRAITMCCIVGAQRPAWIPRHAGTESDHYYIHFLPLESDRDTMYEYTGAESIVNRPIKGHEFYYFRHGMRDAQPVKLDISAASPTGARS